MLVVRQAIFFEMYYTLKPITTILIKSFNTNNNYYGYVVSSDDLKKYHESSRSISDLLERYVYVDVMYVPVNSILFFSGQKDLFFLRKSETFYYFEMILNNGGKYFIPGKPGEVLPTLFDDLIIKD